LYTHMEYMDKIQKALARIEGQIRGIRGMYSEKRDCLEIMQQIAAAREALGSVGREMLKAEACQCMLKKSEKSKFEKLLNKLFKN